MDFEYHEQFPTMLDMVFSPDEFKIVKSAFLGFIRKKAKENPDYFAGSDTSALNSKIVSTKDSEIASAHDVKGTVRLQGVRGAHVELLLEAVIIHELDDPTHYTEEVQAKLIQDLREAHEALDMRTEVSDDELTPSQVAGLIGDIPDDVRELLK